MYKFLVVPLFLLITLRIEAQMLPNENSNLNYRIIGFSFPSAKTAKKYKLEIALGNYYTADSFKNNIIYTGSAKDKKLIAEVPYFGKQYTWRVTAGRANEENNELHHFNTSVIPAVDTAVTRLRVFINDGKYKDAYVFLDGNRALYDMKGNPVWFLPDIGGHNTDLSRLRDMKMTSRGTITFLYEERSAYEINYNGDILWGMPHNIIKRAGLKTPPHLNMKATGKRMQPIPDQTMFNNEHPDQTYHHEFTRLENGHYMVLGVENKMWDNKDQAPFGTVLEYDEKGNLVWAWRSYDYFKNSDLRYHNINGKLMIAAHENSFYFDEQHKVIYVSFRDISRVVKIKYPEGTVLNAYGEVFKQGVSETGNGLYCQQHSISRSGDGYLYLFNNNNCGTGPGDILPGIMKLQEPAPGNSRLKKIWEYRCSIDGIDAESHKPYTFPVGGSVAEMPGGSLLVNMSTVYSKVFIIGPDKKVHWSAIPEQWDSQKKKWNMIPQYRASVISSKKELEKLVWSAELKQ